MTQTIVDELLDALRERLKSSPPDHWRARILAKDATDDDINRLFREDVQGEVDRVKKDFDPKIVVVYKEVTYQTFKDPKFRDQMEKRFGQLQIAALFNEHDAAPEQLPADGA